MKALALLRRTWPRFTMEGSWRDRLDPADSWAPAAWGFLEGMARIDGAFREARWRFTGSVLHEQGHPTTGFRGVEHYLQTTGPAGEPVADVEAVARIMDASRRSDPAHPDWIAPPEAGGQIHVVDARTGVIGVTVVCGSEGLNWYSVRFPFPSEKTAALYGREHPPTAFNNTERVFRFAVEHWSPSAAYWRCDALAAEQQPPLDALGIVERDRAHQARMGEPVIGWLTYFSDDVLAERQLDLSSLAKNDDVELERFHQGVLVRLGDDPLRPLIGGMLAVRESFGCPPRVVPFGWRREAKFWDEHTDDERAAILRGDEIAE